MIYNIPEEYEIPLNHVLCCVTVNASNMIKVVKDMNVDVAAMPQSETASVSGKFKVISSHTLAANIGVKCFD